MMPSPWTIWMEQNNRNMLQILLLFFEKKLEKSSLLIADLLMEKPILLPSFFEKKKPKKPSSEKKPDSANNLIPTITTTPNKSNWTMTIWGWMIKEGRRERRNEQRKGASCHQEKTGTASDDCRKHEAPSVFGFFCTRLAPPAKNV